MLRTARQIDLGRRQGTASGWFDGVIESCAFLGEPPNVRMVKVMQRLGRMPR